MCVALIAGATVQLSTAITWGGKVQKT